MNPFTIAALSSLWFGILTSISPCPLATNITAISFIGKEFKDNKKLFYFSLFYTLGRSSVYLAISIIILLTLISSQKISSFLQYYINKIIGPLMIIIGMYFLEFIQLNIKGFNINPKTQEKISNLGIWGAGFLGIICALAFCPISAALFFGSLIPLSIKYKSIFLFPSLYGLGTAIPVLFFSFIIAFSTKKVSKIFKQISKIETWAKNITGILFILGGIYLTLTYIFKI